MKFPAKYRIPAYALFFLIATEVILRIFFGLGNPVLLQTDADTGYRFRPNQVVFRFGKKTKYNQYSQRSEIIKANKPQGMLRILMVGDSVLNGGTPTDQKETIPELFKKKLITKIRPVEVLNASAGSWGIGNELGYIRKFGTFESDAVILVISTHDLTQPTSTSERVGNDPNYPTQAPLFALQEVWTRYLLPKLSFKPIPAEIPLPLTLEPQQQFKQNMQEFKLLASLVAAKKIPLFVMFMPQLDNLVPTANTPKYKSDFLKLCQKIQVPVIDVHAKWSRLPQSTVKTYFRDNFHPDIPGNIATANLLFEQLCSTEKLSVCFKNFSR